jgi:hypothetical protein
VRALAAHGNQKKSLKETHTSEEFLEIPSLRVLSLSHWEE